MIINRFEIDMDGEMENHPEGSWVRYEDHQKELATLRASQMTEELAREVLGGWVDSHQRIGSLYAERPIGNVDVYWPMEPPSNRVDLKGGFTADQLEAIAWWMRNFAAPPNN